MSNFIYYEHLEDYEEQVRKAKLCDKKDKEIERLKNIINEAINIIQERIIEYGDEDFFGYPRIYDELLSILRGGKMYYGDIELEYRIQLKQYKTKEDKLNYLRDCEFQINMIDRWTEKDEISFKIVNKLIKEVEEND